MTGVETPRCRRSYRQGPAYPFLLAPPRSDRKQLALPPPAVLLREPCRLPERPLRGHPFCCRNRLQIHKAKPWSISLRSRTPARQVPTVYSCEESIISFPSRVISETK